MAYRTSLLILIVLLITGCHSAERIDVLDRVEFIGASATAGFGAEVDGNSVDLSQVFHAAIRTPGGEVGAHGDILFFDHPIESGSKLLDAARASDPTLLVGLDFLFWFGYGYTSRYETNLDTAGARLELLEKGLALLDGFNCPIVLGDFPDMSIAIGTGWTQLRPRQVPTPESRAQLNDRLRAWAAERTNVIIVPLARLFDAMRADQGFIVGGHEWPTGSATTVLQPDRLHPTAEGLIALAQLVAAGLADGSTGLTPEDFDLDPEHVRARLRQEAEEEVPIPGNAPALPTAPIEETGDPGFEPRRTDSEEGNGSGTALWFFPASPGRDPVLTVSTRSRLP